MKKIIYISAIAFVLNFFWEISQAFLYAPHFSGVSGLIAVHIIASLGDVLMVYLILIFNHIIFKSIFSNKLSSKARFIGIALIGFITGIVIEKYALATGRWSYDSLMPIIPLFDVGLVPVLQMTMLPPLILASAEKYKSDFLR